MYEHAGLACLKVHIAVFANFQIYLLLSHRTLNIFLSRTEYLNKKDKHNIPITKSNDSLYTMIEFILVNLENKIWKFIARQQFQTKEDNSNTKSARVILLVHKTLSLFNLHPPVKFHE